MLVRGKKQKEYEHLSSHLRIVAREVCGVLLNNNFKIVRMIEKVIIEKDEMRGRKRLPEERKKREEEEKKKKKREVHGAENDVHGAQERNEVGQKNAQRKRNHAQTEREETRSANPRPKQRGTQKKRRAPELPPRNLPQRERKER